MHDQHDHHRDHNLRAAYLHVLVVGSIVIARWSLGLIRDTSAVLLDAEVRLERREAIRLAVETSGDAGVVDLGLIGFRGH